MSRRMSSLTRTKILKRQNEKHKEDKRELREELAFWQERANRLGNLNAIQQQKIRRLDERLEVVRAREEERRAARPKYSCAKKDWGRMPPLAHKYQSALVVNGD